MHRCPFLPDARAKNAMVGVMPRRWTEVPAGQACWVIHLPIDFDTRGQTAAGDIDIFNPVVAVNQLMGS